jgi:large subunit ribosomal protein L4
MAVVDVYDLKKEKTAELELNKDVFGVPIKNHVLHQVVLSQLAEKRVGSASTKTRSFVTGSTTKLWRQKGTGRARAGASTSPTRRGGGIVFGPTPRAYTLKVPKKVRKAALRMALTDKLQNNRLFVLNDFELPTIKTKDFVEVLRAFEISEALIVTEGCNKNLEKSSRNVQGAKVLRCEGLNVYDILKYENLFLVRDSIGKIEEALLS